MRVLEDYMDSFKTIMLDSIHTFLPGRIISFDGVKMEATVIPLAKVKINGIEIDPQEIEKCPVLYSNDSTFSIRHPYQSGDLILLGFCENSLEKILTTGQPESVVTENKFDITDAIVLGGIDKETDSLPSTDIDGLLLINKNTGHKIVFKSDGSLETTCEVISAPQATITCKKLISENVEASVDVLGGGISLKNHLTTGVESGNKISGPPQ